MSTRTLKFLLGLSVALNVFALAIGTTVAVRQSRLEGDLQVQNRQVMSRPPILTVVENLDPEVRDRVRGLLRASALQAKPDFEEARTKRREAVALAQAPIFEPSRVRGLLEESRAAEARGRARLEADAVSVLETLDAEDRSAVAEILTRRGRSGARQSGEKTASSGS
jgi:uncharacterized membrane protein